MSREELNVVIEKMKEEGLQFLEDLVNTDSPSRDREAVNRAGDVICKFFKKHQITYRIQKNEDPNLGDFIIATIPGVKKDKILLLGHRDTVYPVGTVAKNPFTIKGDRAYGPGVSDMKPGIVTSILAAIALKKLEINQGEIEILITPDEEIGSPSSRKVIEDHAKEAVAVFNLEPGRPDGSIVTTRRGSAHLAFEITGVAAHSGTEIEKGISAIEELGHKIIALQQLTNIEQGVTVNVGMVQGGENTNVVAPGAFGRVHIGFQTIEQFDEVMEKAKTIFVNSKVEGTSGELKGHVSFLPMVKSEGVEEMYNIVKRHADELNIAITEHYARGAADAGFPASLGVPTICGMGPVGGYWHNENEYMEMDSFIPRTQLLAQSIVTAFEQYSK